MTESEEEIYERGQRSAYVSMLYLAINGLGNEGTEVERARWIMERESAVAALRSICEDHGDNDWDAKLWLADVIEKHLHRNLDEKGRSERI